MKAVVYDRFGGPDVLEVRDIAAPAPGETDLLVDVHYAGVNPIDWKIRQGLYENLLEFKFPVVPGWDVAGVVRETGPAVTKFGVGDKIYAMAVSAPIGAGTYAEQTLVAESAAAKIPASLSLQEAAAVPLVATAARDALFRLGKVEKDQRILIQQGAGGVGAFAIQLAKQVDACVYTTCSTRNVDYVKSFGPDRVIDYTAEDFAAVIAGSEPDGLDFVLEGVGGDIFRKSHGVLKAGGRLITMGDFPDKERADKHGITSAFLDTMPNGAWLEEVSAAIDDGRLKLPHISELPIERAMEAQQQSQAGHVCGKLVLKVA